jgi:hypothetical protein
MVKKNTVLVGLCLVVVLGATFFVWRRYEGLRVSRSADRPVTVEEVRKDNLR